MQWTRGRLAVARGLVLGGMGGLLVLAACETKVPTAADVAQMDVASAQRSAAQAGLTRTPASNSTDFFVNGVKVTADQARALEAKDIGSLEVVKSELPTGRDTIFVTTADRMPRDFKAALRSREHEQVEKGGQEVALNRIVRDSTEHMVAHVEGELATMRAADEKQQVTRVRTARPGVEPVYLIDGKRATGTDLAAFDGKDIASISVYKGASAKAMSTDPAAVNGVIVVTTKKAKKN